MAAGPKIVHKQFNSPIGLYSQNNIQETLNKHLQNLDNGTVGIDFNNPATGKPGNLANSAVLRMLEEEELRNRKGYPNKKKVVWPPAPETNGYHSPQQLSPAYAQHSPSQQYQAPQQHYQPYPHSQPPQPQPQPQYAPQSYQAPPSKPAFCEAKRQEPTGLSRLIPIQLSPGVSASPVSPPYRAAPSPAPAPLSPQPYKQQSNRWAPVTAPLSPQAYGSQPNYPSAPQQYSAPQYEYPQRQVEPPATTITLRPSPPVHQQPPPVFASQPAAASFQGGVNMRGDMKWPPQTVKEAVEAENEARRQLAKGPACRPRKMKKDYSSFFAKHALNHNYPGYRVPPGTQHYEDHSGRSSY